MEYAKQGFIAFDGENVLIYGSSQRNHYHAELKHVFFMNAFANNPIVHPNMFL